MPTAESIVALDKVFGIGYPKTDLHSLQNALITLGYKTLHDPHDFRELTLYHGNYRLPAVSTCNYSNNPANKQWDAIVNFGETLYPKLDKIFPNSKFILTYRNPEKWYNLLMQEVSAGSFDGTYLHCIDKQPWWIICAGDLFGGIGFNKDTCIERYIKHKDDVVNFFKKKENLLVMDVDGDNKWQKLCEFLKLPIPIKPYPQLDY